MCSDALGFLGGFSPEELIPLTSPCVPIRTARITLDSRGILCWATPFPDPCVCQQGGHQRQCRNATFHSAMGNLGWKMVCTSRLWCSATPRSPGLWKRVFPKAVVDFSQASLCTGQECWQLSVQLQYIIFCHFDLCSSLQPDSRMRKKSDGVCPKVSSMLTSSADLAN